jgi:uncharacterized Rossmann fold enzyme
MQKNPMSEEEMKEQIGNQVAILFETLLLNKNAKSSKEDQIFVAVSSAINFLVELTIRAGITKQDLINSISEYFDFKTEENN